jgi:transposase
MAEAYAIELRERVVQCHESGEGSYRTIAARFSLGEATVKRWCWLKQKQGHVSPQDKGGGTPSAIAVDDIERLMAVLGDPTAVELTAEFNRRRRGRGRIHVSSMKRALRRHGYVVKKNADGRWRVCARTSSFAAQHS